jgi:hypothetical protein
MAKNRQYLPEDWLEIFVNRVRSVGVWCDTKVTDHYRHKFVCRNPNANIAISLCGQVIAPFEKLHENVITQKCLICDLYDIGPKEVQEKIQVRLDAKIDEVTQTQTQTTEK